MPVYATFRYADAPAAIAWLEAALDFAVHARSDSPDGLVAHAEVASGDGLVMLGSTRDEGADVNQTPGASTTYVGIEDLDDVRRRWGLAQAAGADVVRELAEMDYGSLEFSVRDPEGNVWSVGSYSPRP